MTFGHLTVSWKILHSKKFWFLEAKNWCASFFGSWIGIKSSTIQMVSQRAKQMVISW